MTAPLKPLVSVIIPSYNMEEYIAETLRSVINSTYENLEIIVVDDGSSDNSLAIARDYAERDNRIRVYSQPNQGVSVARNLALRESRGEYILPVDADDVISKTFIEEAAAVLAQDPEVKVVACNCEFFGNRTGEWKLPDFKLHKLATDNRLCASSMYRRADAIQIGGYSEIVVAREDWEFWISMLKDGGKVVKLPRVGFYYRVRSASKRFRDRECKAQTIDGLNRLHPDFFEHELGGKLHMHRSQSILHNRIYRLLNPRKVYIAEGYESLEWHIKALLRIVEYAEQGGTCATIEDDGSSMLTLNLKGKQVMVKIFEYSWGWYLSSKAEQMFVEGLQGYTPIAFYAQSRWIMQNKSFCLFVKN